MKQNPIKRQMSFMHAENRKYGQVLMRVPRAQWPHEIKDLFLVFRSRDFLVQFFTRTPRPAVCRMTVSRTMIDAKGEWLQGITWDDLMRLKGEAGFGACWAVEVFPPQWEVVNVANMRHLWILEKKPEYAWGAPVTATAVTTEEEE